MDSARDVQFDVADTPSGAAVYKLAVRLPHDNVKNIAVDGYFNVDNIGYLDSPWRINIGLNNLGIRTSLGC
jgi:hypothetical protein